MEIKRMFLTLIIVFFLLPLEAGSIVRNEMPIPNNDFSIFRNMIPVLPNINLKQTVKLESGIIEDGPFKGFFYVKYLERPNNPGQFVDKDSSFLNTWLIFHGRKNGEVVEFVRPVVLVVRLWSYNAETRKKSCDHWEINAALVQFVKFVEDVDNIILGRGQIISLFNDEPAASEFLSTSEQLSKKLLRRIDAKY